MKHAVLLHLTFRDLEIGTYEDTEVHETMNSAVERIEYFRSLGELDEKPIAKFVGYKYGQIEIRNDEEINKPKTECGAV